jgi:hypothetical protein
MANSNNICTRFINYVAVLILAFLSSQSFAAGGSFGGGGASGSWEDASCDGFSYTISGTPGKFSSPEAACRSVIIQYEFSHVKDLTCSYLVNGTPYAFRTVSKTVDTKCQECKDGYEKDANGKCQPKKCPVGETLVNGQCQKKQCPAGQSLDLNGNCMFPDDQCPAGQTLVNGRCATSDNPDDPEQNPDDPEQNPDDPEQNPDEWPTFCEWANEMCSWHKEWQQWSNDYNSNEQTANLDRQELKIGIDQIKQQDQQFYDELRLWLNNFNPSDGDPSEQNPSIDFPVFCDWSVQVCNWYLDWQDWRTDYTANNEQIKQRLDQHLERLQQIKEQDAEHYEETKSFFNRAREFFDETLTFFDEIRDFLDQQGTDQENDNAGEITPEEKNIEVDETKRINFVSSCPAGEQVSVTFMGKTENLEFSYQPLCQFMTMIRPFVIAIAYLIGAYIVMGLSRGSSE